MGNQKQWDMAGMDLIVENLRVGATRPGQTGEVLEGSDITALMDVTAGTAVAEKAVVLDASKGIATITTATITTMTGDVVGNVTGDVTGNVTGNVTGDVTGDVSGSLTAVVATDTVRIPQAVDDVHDTVPTAASIVTALGAPARGKIGTIDDASGEVNGYLCFASDNSWFYLKFTKAS